MEHEKRQNTTVIEVDGEQLVGALRKAGLEPEKLNLRGVLGKGVDVEELESRLRGAAAARSGWHVTVSVSVSKD